MELEEAKQKGAIALFEEVYKDRVRVIKIGDFSMELCAGCHVSRTSQLGLFKILKEGGVAKGIRRIEAITSISILKYIQELEDVLTRSSMLLKADRFRLVDKISQIIQELREKELLINQYKEKLLTLKAEELLAFKEKLNNKRIIIQELNEDKKTLGLCADMLISRLKSQALVILFSKKEEKLSWVCKLTKDLTDKVDAREIVEELAKVCGGGGGGRADFASAGGGDKSKLEQTISFAKDLLKKWIK
jgi:alanyl-tRNA synthetase